MTFRIGQKVVCIDASPSLLGDLSELIEGTVYTVLSLTPHGGVTLSEIAPPPHYLWFAGVRFRPVVERKTSIDIFTAMLKPSRVDA